MYLHVRVNELTCYKVAFFFFSFFLSCQAMYALVAPIDRSRDTLKEEADKKKKKAIIFLPEGIFHTYMYLPDQPTCT